MRTTNEFAPRVYILEFYMWNERKARNGRAKPRKTAPPSEPPVHLLINTHTRSYALALEIMYRQLTDVDVEDD